MAVGLIDRAALDRLDDLDPEGFALRRVVALFLTDGPEQLAELDDACRDGDAPRAFRSLHNLKGSSGIVGATGLAELCAQVEHKAAAGQPPAPDLVALLHSTLELVVTELVAELARRLPAPPDTTP